MEMWMRRMNEHEEEKKENQKQIDRPNFRSNSDVIIINYFYPFIILAFQNINFNIAQNIPEEARRNFTVITKKKKRNERKKKILFNIQYCILHETASPLLLILDLWKDFISQCHTCAVAKAHRLFRSDTKYKNFPFFEEKQKRKNFSTFNFLLCRVRSSRLIFWLLLN